MMIEKVLRQSQKSKTPKTNQPDFETFIDEEVEKLKHQSADSYHFIQPLFESCPSLGFVGTIVGATLAFGHASIILKETEPFFQGEAMSTLTGDLSISFFTTLVGLLAALVLSFAIKRTEKSEAELFQVLANTAKRKLKKYWYE